MSNFFASLKINVLDNPPLRPPSRQTTNGQLAIFINHPNPPEAIAPRTPRVRAGSIPPEQDASGWSQATQANWNMGMNFAHSNEMNIPAGVWNPQPRQAWSQQGHGE
jgi:hypothetical protein